MITIRNLAKVERSIANLVVCAELAGAGIPAFDTIRFRSQRITVRGLLQFTNGQAANFTRTDEQYFVLLRDALPESAVGNFDELTMGYGLSLRCEGEHILKLSSSVAVESAVKKLIELYGRPIFNAQIGPTASVGENMPEYREFLPAPRGKREIAKFEIRALLAFGRACGSPGLALRLKEDALWEAMINFGDRSSKALDIRASLARDYKASIEEMQKRSTDGVSVPFEGDDTLVEGMERSQRSYVRTLRELGRHKQARSEEAKLPAMRLAVEKVYVDRLNRTVKELKQFLAGFWHGLPRSRCFRYTALDSIAYTILRLADLYRVMGREYEALRLEQEGWGPARDLNLGADLTRAIERERILTVQPHRYEELLLAVREGQRASRRRRRQVRDVQGREVRVFSINPARS